MTFKEYLAGIAKTADGNTKKSTQSDYDALAEYINNRTTSTQTVEKPDLGESPKYERDDYNAPSEQELSDRARSELQADAYAQRQAIEKSIARKAEDYEERKTAAQQQADSRRKDLKAAYDTALNNVNNDALKRGIARSSIAVGKVGALGEAYASSNERITDELYNEINKLDGNIRDLSLERETALEEFDITQAAKLTARINELRAESEKRKQEAMKYNNSLTEKEFNQSMNKAKTESSLYTDALNQRAKERNLSTLSDKELEQAYADIYSEMDKYLSTLSPKEAENMVANDELFYRNLNNYYYAKLYNKYVKGGN